MKILIIADENLLADSLKMTLTAKGFEVETICNDQDGIEYAEFGIYDILILDIMTPSLDGYRIVRKVLAKRFGLPILILSEKADTSDRIKGLNAGADYYLGKPLDTQELLACINASLRHAANQIDILSYGNTTLELSTYSLVNGSLCVKLSAREFDIMRQFMQSQNRNIPKGVLLARVWGYNSNAVENHVEVYVGFLRKKMKQIKSNLKIVSIRRVGYHLEISEE